jgi:5-methylcytosine-specific restriction endonuclease McrA
MSNKQKIICEQCKKEFESYPNLKRKICSNLCRYNWQRGRKRISKIIGWNLPLICNKRKGKTYEEIYGEEYAKKIKDKLKDSQNNVDRNGKNNPFFGKKHTWKSINKILDSIEKRPKRKIGLFCNYCNKIFYVFPYLKNRKFCSPRCNALGHPEKIKILIINKGIKPRTYHLKEHIQRGGIVYTEWRKDVYKRDNYTCQICGISSNNLKKISKKIHADHIKSFAYYPKLRYDINNGRTLCEDCHKKTENYGIKSRSQILKPYLEEKTL